METILLPGIDGTGKLFVSLRCHLVPEFCPRVVSYSPNQARNYEELIDDIVVPSGPFAIVAESFSGPLGIRLATTHPVHLKALVLVATFISNPSILAKRLHGLIGRRLFRLGIPDIALRFGLIGMEATKDEVYSLRSTLRSVAPEILSTRLREIISVDVSNEFSTSTVPLLYLAGKRDRLIGTKAMTQMKRIRPDMKTHVLDAPHMVLQRRPEESARLISEFLLSKLD